MYSQIFQKQKIMRRVVYSLVPLFIFGIYLYGWRPVAQALVVFPVGIAVEYLFEKKRGKKVSEAVLVTCALYTIALPPAVPLWISAVGIAFAIAIAKEAYGGFGRNVFNPAITGRLFIWIAFAAPFATAWMTPGGFGAGEAGVDLVTAATPLEMMEGGDMPRLADLLIGTRSGSIGESSIILIALSGIYLIWTKTAQWRLILSTLISAAGLSAVFYYSGVSPFPPHYAMFSGSVFVVAVFYATDPISAPNKTNAQWIYGFIIGLVTVLVRAFTGFNEGASFGIFVANVFSSLLDELMPNPKKPKPKKKASAEKPAAAKEAV